jgi:hypothetical protein
MSQVKSFLISFKFIKSLILNFLIFFLDFHQKNQSLFVITVIFQKIVCYKHEILLKNDAKPNQEVIFVRYNREFVITVIVITEFDCTFFARKNLKQKRKYEVKEQKQHLQAVVCGKIKNNGKTNIIFLKQKIIEFVY